MASTTKALHSYTRNESTALTTISDDDSVSFATVSDDEKDNATSSGVSFGIVKIREYNRTVGDHPDVTRGAPMTLDWEYWEHSDIDLSQYEQVRQGERTKYLRMTSSSRNELLLKEFHVTPEEWEAAAELAKKTRQQRAESAKDRENSSVWNKVSSRRFLMTKQGSDVKGDKKKKKGPRLFKNLRRSLSIR